MLHANWCEKFHIITTSPGFMFSKIYARWMKMRHFRILTISVSNLWYPPSYGKVVMWREEMLHATQVLHFTFDFEVEIGAVADNTSPYVGYAVCSIR